MGGYAESMRRRASRSADADGLLAELAADVRDERVLAAIAAVPRDRFVPKSLRDRAWANTSLPIAAGQTISQPVVVARMCELLELTGTETVLDVGTGSGYHAAVLAQLAARVVSIERHEELAEAARASLAAAGVRTVELYVGDGTLGRPEAAPFDAINVAAASRRGIPAALEEQLAPGGRLVIPADGPAASASCWRAGWAGSCSSSATTACASCRSSAADQTRGRSPSAAGRRRLRGARPSPQAAGTRTRSIVWITPLVARMSIARRTSLRVAQRGRLVDQAEQPRLDDPAVGHRELPGEQDLRADRAPGRRRRGRAGCR